MYNSSYKVPPKSISMNYNNNNYESMQNIFKTKGFTVKEQENTKNPVYIKNRIVGTSEIVSLLNEIKQQEKDKYNTQIKEMKLEMQRLKEDIKKVTVGNMSMLSQNTNNTLFHSLNKDEFFNQSNINQGILNNPVNLNNYLVSKKPVLKIEVNNIYNNKSISREINESDYERNVDLIKKVNKEAERELNAQQYNTVMDRNLIIKQYKEFLKNEEELYLREEAERKNKKYLEIKKKTKSKRKLDIIKHLFYAIVVYKTLRKIALTRKKRVENEIEYHKIFKEDLYVITRYSCKRFLTVFNNINLLIIGNDLEKDFNKRLPKDSYRERNKIIIEMLKIINNQMVRMVNNYNEMNVYVKEALYRYVRDRTYYVEEFLFTYEINRIDFNMFGIPKPINDETAAMILGMFIISKAFVFNFLFKPERFNNNAMRQSTFKNAAAFVGSVIHRLIEKMFIENTVKVFDYFSFVNFFWSKRIVNKEVNEFEFLKGDNKFELSEHQINKNLYSKEDTDTFIENEKIFCLEFIITVKKYLISLAKRLRNE